MCCSPEPSTPTEHPIINSKQSLPHSKNAFRSPPANPWAHLSITWSTSLTKMLYPEQLTNSLGEHTVDVIS